MQELNDQIIQYMPSVMQLGSKQLPNNDWSRNADSERMKWVMEKYFRVQATKWIHKYGHQLQVKDAFLATGSETQDRIFPAREMFTLQ